MIVVLYGPAGAGKTTVGQALAERLHWCFIEGDAFHSPQSIARMRAGQPLGDAERAPWLAALAREIAVRIADGRSAVLACPVLKPAYRRALVPADAGPDDVRLACLRAPRAVLERRLRQRGGHFFSPALFDAQLADVEAAAGEDVLLLDATESVECLVDRLAQAFALPVHEIAVSLTAQR